MSTVSPWTTMGPTAPISIEGKPSVALYVLIVLFGGVCRVSDFTCGPHILISARTDWPGGPKQTQRKTGMLYIGGRVRRLAVVVLGVATAAQQVQVSCIVCIA